jgi:hypothetical protein
VSGYDRVLEKTHRLSDSERPALAAERLNRVGVGRGTRRTFADAPDDTNRGELCTRVVGEPERR